MILSSSSSLIPFLDREKKLPKSETNYLYNIQQHFLECSIWIWTCEIWMNDDAHKNVHTYFDDCIAISQYYELFYVLTHVDKMSK